MGGGGVRGKHRHICHRSRVNVYIRHTVNIYLLGWRRHNSPESVVDWLAVIFLARPDQSNFVYVKQPTTEIARGKASPSCEQKTPLSTEGPQW